MTWWLTLYRFMRMSLRSAKYVHIEFLSTFTNWFLWLSRLQQILFRYKSAEIEFRFQCNQFMQILPSHRFWSFTWYLGFSWTWFVCILARSGTDGLKLIGLDPSDWNPVSVTRNMETSIKFWPSGPDRGSLNRVVFFGYRISVPGFNR